MGVGAQCLEDRIASELANEPAQHLEPRPVRGGALTFVARAPQDEGWLFGDARGELLGCGRLADPRLTDQEGETRSARRSLPEGRSELLDLVLPTDENAVGRAFAGSGFQLHGS